MAKKASRPSRPAARSQSDPRDRLIDAALALAARQGWRRTGLAAIAAEADLPLHEAYALYRSKHAILHGFLRRTDEAVLAGAADEDEPPSRDRLFDTLMRRFDALKPHRDAIRAILLGGIGDPAALLSLPAALRSMAWMLEAAGISAAGCRGRLRAHLLAAIYGSVLRLFLDDESEDLAATMAALDRRLRRAEGFFGFAAERRGGAQRAAG